MIPDISSHEYKFNLLAYRDTWANDKCETIQATSFFLVIFFSRKDFDINSANFQVYYFDYRIQQSNIYINI